jgi:hypothetical protein
MGDWQIILTLLVFLTGCHPWSAQQLAPAAPPMASPYPMTSAPVVVIDQSGAAAGPMIVPPAPQGTTILPPQSTVVPLPSHTPGSVFGPPAMAPVAPTTGIPEVLPPPPGVVGPIIPGTMPPGVSISPLADVAAGGMVSPQFGLPAGPEIPAGPGNPISVPAVDEELAWDQITDVVADYFTISREQRARRSGDVWTEGRIETAPQDGATWLEPHRGDSVGAFNRWESTFQTIRRRATIRVIPDANGYLVEAIVEKELEDLRNPEKATAGAATFRNDNSLPSRRLEEVSRTRLSPRWIPLGRDPALEQRLLAEIHARLTGVTIGQASVFGH